MKKINLMTVLLLITVSAAPVYAWDPSSGFTSLQSTMLKVASSLGVILVIVSGLIMMKHKEQGVEKFTGALMGLMVVGAAAGLVPFVIRLFS